MNPFLHHMSRFLSITSFKRFVYTICQSFCLYKMSSLFPIHSIHGSSILSMLYAKPLCYTIYHTNVYTQCEATWLYHISSQFSKLMWCHLATHMSILLSIPYINQFCYNICQINCLYLMSSQLSIQYVWFQVNHYVKPIIHTIYIKSIVITICQVNYLMSSHWTIPYVSSIVHVICHVNCLYHIFSHFFILYVRLIIYSICQVNQCVKPIVHTPCQ